MSYKTYELTVSRIRCTNCAKKITTALNPLKGVREVRVDVLAERVIVTIDVDVVDLERIETCLREVNFSIIGSPREFIPEGSKERKLVILFNQQHFSNIAQVQTLGNDLQQQLPAGIHHLSAQSFKNKNLPDWTYQLIVNYFPDIIKGVQIYDVISSLCDSSSSHQSFDETKEQDNIRMNTTPEPPYFMIYNDILHGLRFHNDSNDYVSLPKLFLAIAITLFYIVFIMILPMTTRFDEAVMYPNNNFCSLYMISGFLITVFTMIVFGSKFYKSAFYNYTKQRVLNMDTLVTLGSLSAFIMTLFMIIIYSNQSEDTHHNNMVQMQIMNICHMQESTALILTVITIGKYFEGKVKKSILSMQQQLFPKDKLLETTEYVVINPKNKKLLIDSQKKLDVTLIEKGDLISLCKGMKLLFDGVILKGEVSVIDSICYGNDETQMAKEGYRVKSGAEIIDGECILQVEANLENSTLFQIQRQLSIAQSSDQSEVGVFGIFKRLSDHFVKGVIILSMIVLISWIVLIYFDLVSIQQHCVWCFPFERAISILVASCPCSLGLAIPSVVVITLNRALKQGILIKKNSIFENISRVKNIYFDKTGTLFTRIDKLASYRFQEYNDLFTSDVLEDDLWNCLAMLEKNSRHPLGHFLYREAISRQTNKQIPFVLLESNHESRQGVSGLISRADDVYSQYRCHIGNKFYLQDQGIEIGPSCTQQISDKEEAGLTIILFAIQNKIVLQIELDNKQNLRSEAKLVVRYLQANLQKNVHILSGDSKKTVQDVGKYLDLPEENLYGEMDSQAKQQFFLEGDTNNKDSIMIGDGLNDILSLKEAGIGISINAKSELNLIASDVIILSENLWKIPTLINLLTVANRIIYINLFWAFAYNIFMAPIAAGLFHSRGFTISPMISSSAMSVSSIVVVLISQFIKCANITPRVQGAILHETDLKV